MKSENQEFEVVGEYNCIHAQGGNHYCPQRECK